jgi:Protein of unknown function (DUF2637)
MSNYSVDRGPHSADPLRLVALTAVIAGVVLLAAAAFVLSYAGIHQIAVRAGVSPQLARLYPVIFDAMLVVAGAAALALRGAGWWARFYAWASLLILLVAVAAGDALHATHVVLPIQPTRAVAAVIPWAFLLVAFGLMLEMLRHFRRTRAGNGHAAAAGDAALAGAVANGTGGAGAGNGDPGSPAQRAAVTWAAAGGAGPGRALTQSRTGLDLLLGPRETDPPALSGGSTATVAYPGHHPDQVAYGEETGYVHPDSYRDHVDYPGPDPAAHEGDTAPGDPVPQDGAKQDHPADATAPPNSEAKPDGEAKPADQPGKTADQPEKGESASKPESTAPPPAAAAPAEPTVQASPAGTQDSAAPKGDPPEPPDRAVMPLLERLRSTPAPPED